MSQVDDSLDDIDPQILSNPGSKYNRELAKFEQFPGTRITGGTLKPGNPYVFRPYPMMLFKAFDGPNGKLQCMAAPPDRQEYIDPQELFRHEESARRFTEKCQRIVKDEREMSAAMEDGWRQSPEEAMEVGLARQRAIANAAAHRNYEDRNMSEAAKAEIAEAEQNADGHLGEIKERPRRRRRRAS